MTTNHHPSRIRSKQQSYRLWEQGSFGNKLRTWNALEEITKSGYAGTVTMRYKGHHGGGLVAYNVPLSSVPETQRRWISEGAQPDLITFNESAPDEYLLIQGEVTRLSRGLYLFYNREKKKMREALINARSATGLTARIMLEHYLDPSSYEDIQALLALFPDHAIEFSTYNAYLGNIPGRNTIMWEVRNY